MSSPSLFAKYAYKLPPGEGFRVLVVGEQASCTLVLSAVLHREDLLLHEEDPAHLPLHDAESITSNSSLPTSSAAAAAPNGRPLRVVRHEVEPQGQTLEFILEEKFLCPEEEGEDECAGWSPPARSSLYPSAGLEDTEGTDSVATNGTEGHNPQPAAEGSSQRRAFVVSDTALEEAVRRRRRNDMIYQFVHENKHVLDVVWFCFASRDWSHKEARMKKEAEFIQKKLSADVKVIIVHVMMSPFENSSGGTESDALRWLSAMKASIKPGSNLRAILPMHLGSDERDAHLDVLAKETVWSFVQHERVQLASGSVYNGDVVHGKLHGFGKEETATGDSFLGDWVSGLKQGFGTIRYSNGDKYEGAWEGGMRHGNGRYTWPSGRYFDGTWFEGKREGPGSICFSDKSKFEGIWIQDKPEGRGKIIYENGDTYYGMIAFHAQSSSTVYPIDYLVSRSGEGEMHQADGSRYVGSFVKDQRNGYGIFVFPDGERYQGMWKDNKRHGYGTFQYNDGTIFEGTWFNDTRKGDGRLCHANGDVVLGSWQGDQITQAKFSKGSLAQAAKSSQKLFTNTLKTAQKLGQGDLVVYTQKWTGFVSDSEASSQVIVDSYADLIASLGNRSHTVGQAIDKFVNMFEAVYSDFTEENVTHLIPQAVDDVASFITFKHKELEKRIKWEPPVPENESSKLVLVALKDAVFSRVYPRLFSLYQLKNRKKDTLLKTKLDSLWRLMPKDLGIQMAWESSWEEKELKRFVKSPHKIQHRSSRSGSFSMSDSNSSDAKDHPFLLAIRSLRSIHNETSLRGKLQCLMDTSKHILIGCSPQKAAPRPYGAVQGQAPLVYIGAEEKFPVFVFVVIKAAVHDLHAHTDFLSDFLPQHTITKTEGGYRLTELKAAMEFIMKLHPNLRNAKGELVPLSTIKNDLKMALASVRQKLNAYHRAKEKERDEREARAKEVPPSPSASPSLLRASNGLAASEPNGVDFQFKLGFLVNILKEVAHRDEDFYVPMQLDDDERRMLRNELNASLLDIVLNSIGMEMLHELPDQSSSSSNREEGKEKKAATARSLDLADEEGWGVRSRTAKTKQGQRWVGFKRRLPLWVYDHLADTLALHLPTA